MIVPTRILGSTNGVRTDVDCMLIHISGHGEMLLTAKINVLARSFFHKFGKVPMHIRYI